LRKFLLIIVLIPLLGGLAWWHFREQALPDYGPAYREYAYVTNGKSNTVSVIDLRTFEPAKTIAVGIEPTGVAANSKKNEVYVVNTGSNNVSVIDAEKNAVVATIGVHGKPYFIDVAEDGRRAYVANSASANVSVIDLEKRLVIGNIHVGAAPGLARISPDGGTVVVSNRGDNSISLIDARLLRLRATLSACRQPEDIAILPDSSKAFVTCSGSGQVASIDLKHDHVLALIDVGRTPVSLALKPDGGELVASIDAFGLDGNQVRPIDVVRAHPERAFLFIHCAGDKLIAPHHAYELRAASTNPKSDLWMAAVCQHSWAFNSYPTAYEAHLGAFLESQIPAHTPAASP